MVFTYLIQSTYIYILCNCLYYIKLFILYIIIIYIYIYTYIIIIYYTTNHVGIWVCLKLGEVPQFWPLKYVFFLGYAFVDWILR